MRDLDNRAIKEMGVPELVLMENAGLAVLKTIQDNFDDLSGLKVSVFAGKGNNGGDGIVTARLLYNMGAKPTLFVAARKGDLKGDARINLDAYSNIGGIVKQITERRHLNNFKLKFMHSSVIIDALLGTGSRPGPLKGLYADIVDAMNKSPGLKIAVDIPTGIDSDSGAAPDKCFNADISVALQLPKVGLVTSPARNFTGHLVVSDISIPPKVISESPCAAYMMESEDISKILPSRAWDAHKGQFGHLVMACGSRTMSGAPVLAGSGALKMGVGLITAGGPEAISDMFPLARPELMSLPLPQTESGSISEKAAEKFLDFAKDKTAVLLGPGISTDASTIQFAKKVIGSLNVPMVIDADGLNCIGDDSDILKKRKAPTIITPHPGEMARLTGKTIAEVQTDRIKTASDYAGKTGVVVVLKGAGTVTASRSGEVYFNHTGNNGLATGGAGDVLAGMIAGVLAQGAHPEDAAVAPVFLHGQCADSYAEKYDSRSFTPTDILEMLPEVIKQITG